MMAQQYQKQINSQRAVSAAQFLAMLSDNILEKQVYALRKISQIVDYQWPEISDQLPRIESLMDEENFPEKQLAASIASKVFYYLQEHDEALRLALEAGDRFDISLDNLYIETLVHKCIDLYIQKQVAIVDHNDQSVQVDPRMETIVNKKFEQCFSEGNFKHVIGIAMSARRLDAVQQAIESSTNPEALLGYTFQIANETIRNKEFKTKVLRMILLIYQRRKTSIVGSNFDYYKIAKCQFHLNLPDLTSSLLEKLVQEENSDDYLVAYQIAFDLVDKEQQVFTTAVINHIQANTNLNKERQTLLLSILRGQIKERLTLQFLKKNNYTDMLLIGKIKDAVPTKNSMLHSAVIWMNGMMNAYTTNDTFVKDNMNWVSQATNWNRFQATASLGMIHMCNSAQAHEVLNPYLVGGAGQGAGASSPYATAGAYFAFGLIHANQYSKEVCDFFLEGYRNSAENEAILHGLSLGLGLVGMATKDAALYSHFKDRMIHNLEQAVPGEAHAIGMGLVMIGSADESAIDEMIQQAAQNNHEKIIRALGISLALIMYGKEQQADGLIEQMCNSKDSTIRYGAMFTIGCAYAGTASCQATRRLLKFAVSETSDDVKRAALMNIGFLYFRDHKQVPFIVKHLAGSHNPHLRYGAALAIGIGCAGTGSQDALRILAPLAQDKIDFVRQGALIALSMVFIQVTDKQEPKVATIRKLYEKKTGDKYEPILSRVGAIISNGILNAAGRNTTISMTTHDGNLRQNTVVGLVLFLQHWYWYPMLNFLSLALTPTTLIAVNHKLKVPKSFKIIVKAAPNTFSYPELLKKKEVKAVEKVETAVLSTTAKVKARHDRKHKAEGGDVEMTSAIDTTDIAGADKEEKKDEETKAEVAVDADEYILNNPTRVLKAQELKIQYHNDVESRYWPVMDNRFSGFIVLRETRQLHEGEKEEFYDDEERNLEAPNPDLFSDIHIPASFEFDPAIQNAP